jgi:hypothetical protein
LNLMIGRGAQGSPTAAASPISIGGPMGAPTSYVTGPSIRWLGQIIAARLGLPLLLEHEGENLVLRLAGADGHVEFPCYPHAFARFGLDLPCAGWNARAEGWNPPVADNLPAPGAECLPEPLIVPVGNIVRFGYDLPGLMFWQLGRVEEIGRADLDEHGRFPATASHALKHGYLERPIVDEWLVILAQVVSRLWPPATVRKPSFSTIVSHDVDVPARYALCSPGDWVRRVTGAASRRRWSEVAGAFHTPLGKGAGIASGDPYNTYSWLMDQSEVRGLRSTFYFMAGCTDPKHDAGYDPSHPAIRSLVRTIASRGHGIGIHPSYGTYGDPAAIARECTRLRQIVAEELGYAPPMGGRAHYLRWSQPTTSRAFAAAGLVQDASLGYPDRIGFRAATCHPYPAFDPVAHETLAITIQPLVAMEGTVLDYMGLGEGRPALQLLMEMKRTCKRVGGAFSMLWHNSELDSAIRKSMYLAVLDS